MDTSASGMGGTTRGDGVVADHADHAETLDRATTAGLTMTRPVHFPASYDAPQPAAMRIVNNSLILSHIAPYLTLQDVVSLAATCKMLREIVHSTPTMLKSFNVMCLRKLFNGRASPDDIRRGFRGLYCHGWLSGVTTLILDDAQADATIVRDILTSPLYNVRFLSLRSPDHQSLPMAELRTVLEEAVERTRARGTPLTLRGLYVFGDSESFKTQDRYRTLHRNERPVHGTSEDWYQARGRIMSSLPSTDSDAAVHWAATMVKCEGTVAFDGVLCTSPRHLNSPAHGAVACIPLDEGVTRGIWGSMHPRGTPSAPYTVATMSLGGCATCGSCPEGLTTWGDAGCEGGPANRFPLLWPPPTMQSTVRHASCPDGQPLSPNRAGSHLRHDQERAGFVPRCAWCIFGRWCGYCNKWWCESCVDDIAIHGSPDGASRRYMAYNCFQCSPTCPECLPKTEKQCKKCRQKYCVVHDHGSSATHCDWCNGRSSTAIEAYQNQRAVSSQS